jgi:hypothetical protein
MTLARILIAALLFFSLPAFTQDQNSGAQLPTMGTYSFAPDMAAATSTEPWRIIPNPNSNPEPTDHMRVDQFRFDRGRGTDHSNSGAKTRTLVLGLDGLDADTTCYKIRSYVVARDSKDSDSTHMTGYSTCQPASKYRVKTTEGDPILLQP